MGKLKNLKGQKFGALEVLEQATSARNGKIRWNCLCECGKEKVYLSDHLTRKKASMKSCGCRITNTGPRHSAWKGHGDISGNWWYNHVLRERKQKTRTKVPVEITVEYAWKLFLKQDKKCSLSGIELDIANTAVYNTASIDRIDNSKGYVKGNVQWVHKDINFMKRIYSQNYFINMCKKVAKNNEDKEM